MSVYALCVGTDRISPQYTLILPPPFHTHTHTHTGALGSVGSPVSSAVVNLVLFLCLFAGNTLTADYYHRCVCVCVCVCVCACACVWA
jgi:hypothetical protein